MLKLKDKYPEIERNLIELYYQSPHLKGNSLFYSILFYIDQLDDDGLLDLDLKEYENLREWVLRYPEEITRYASDLLVEDFEKIISLYILQK